MKKFIKKLMKIGLVILICFIAFQLNSAHYKKLADDRIEKVIELQGADFEKAEIHIDRYDYFEKVYVKYIYLKMIQIFNTDITVKEKETGFMFQPILATLL
jgi:hypothetical protein